MRKSVKKYQANEKNSMWRKRKKVKEMKRRKE